jgi:hypothetical protein
MTLGVPVVCFVLFLALSSIAIFAPRRLPSTAALAELKTRAPLITLERSEAIRPKPLIAWPAELDPRAGDADPAVRIALAGELAACRGGWARELVIAALAQEPDPSVRAALAAARAAHESYGA